jgi:N,N'-diacetyllegionaminate synthase
MLIGHRKIGPEAPPFVIAEVAQTHEGSLGCAHSFIDVAKGCGADAVKFQTHFASEESSPLEPWRVKFSRQDTTRYDYWKRMEFTAEQWRGLKEHCDEVGIIFLSSPFSIRACELLDGLGMAAWKLASGEVHNAQIVEWIAGRTQPVIISTGLSTLAEAQSLCSHLRLDGREIAVLHCTTNYPTAAKEVGLNVLENYLQAFPDLPVGLSDHSGSVVPGIVASFLGASVLEVHLTLHPVMFGPDVSSSLTPESLTELIRGARFAWEMRRSPVSKDEQLGRLSRVRSIFGRSLFAASQIAAGEVIDEGRLAYKKPGGGIPYERRGELIGKAARRDIPADHMLGLDDVE